MTTTRPASVPYRTEGSTAPRSVLSVVAFGLGLALLGAAIVLAVASALAPADEASSQFLAIRWPVNGAVIGAAAIPLAAVLGASVLRPEHRNAVRAFVVVTSVIATQTVLLVRRYYDVGGADSDGHHGHPLAQAAFWMLLGGLALTVCGSGVLIGSKRRMSAAVGVAVVAIIATAITVLVVRPGTPREPSATEATVVTEDLHEVAELAPTAQSAETIDLSDSGGHPLVGIGPGFLEVTEAGIQLRNADTGTVRWRVDVPERSRGAAAVERMGLVVMKFVGVDGPRSMGIDADTGAIRWDTTGSVFTDSGYGPAAVTATDQLVSFSGEGWTVQLFDPATGRLRWTHRLADDCAASSYRSTPESVVIDMSCSGQDMIQAFDADSGEAEPTVTRKRFGEPQSRAEAEFWFAQEPDYLVDRFDPVFGPDNELTALIDRTTGRQAVTLAARHSLVSCDPETLDCLVSMFYEQSGRLVSLTGAHPDVPVGSLSGADVWLPGQLLATSGEDLPIIDRSTGRVAGVADDVYDVAVVRGRVLLGSKDGRVRLLQEARR